MKDKLRIAFLAPEFYPPWGGVGVYSIQLIKEFSKDPNLEIHVFTPKRGKDYDPKKVLKYFGNRIKLHNIGNAFDEFAYNAIFQFNLWKEFPKFHNKYHFDLIHSANLVHMPDVLLKFRNLGIPSVVTAHTTINGQVSGFLQSNKNFFKMAPSEKGSILAYPIISLLEKIYLAKTKHMITVSHTFAKMFKQEYKFKGKISVIHNGIDLELFDPKKVTLQSALKRFPTLKGKKRIVLYAGRLITQKGIKVFVEVMSKVSDHHFVIAGKGDAKELFRLIKEYNVPSSRYTFLGFVPNHELPKLYKLTNVFVLPSYYENFPISLLEAGAMGCYCIASDVGAVKEIIISKRDGKLVQPGDSGAIVKILHAKHSYPHSSTRFSALEMAKKTKAVYEALT